MLKQVETTVVSIGSADGCMEISEINSDYQFGKYMSACKRSPNAWLLSLTTDSVQEDEMLHSLPLAELHIPTSSSESLLGTLKR